MRCASEMRCARKVHLEQIELHKQEEFQKKEQAYLKYRPQLDTKVENSLMEKGKATIDLIPCSWNDEIFYGTPILQYYSHSYKMCGYTASQKEVINLSEYIDDLRSMGYYVEIGFENWYVYEDSICIYKTRPIKITKIIIIL